MDNRKSSYTKPYVIAPAGKCPVGLESIDDEAIKEWVIAVQKAQSNSIMSNEALKYWVQYSFDIFSPEWYHVRDRIDKTIKNVQKFKPLGPKKKNSRKKVIKK